jgi:signal peptidase II
MSILILTFLAVLVGDLTLKSLLRRGMGTSAAPLGAVGKVQVVDGRLWLQQMRAPSSRLLLCSVWLAAALALLIIGHWIPFSPAFAGLLLGGSLSNAAEYARRGAVSDYICLRFWPAFNLADIAVAVGAIAMLIELIIWVAGAAT